VTVERRSRRWSAARLEVVARNLMSASPLVALATVAPRGRAYISHMYFAWTDSFDVCWISDPDSKHSRNLARNSSAAVTIYDSRQIWGRPDRGIHLFGAAAEVTGRRARQADQAYAKRFPSYDGLDDSLRLYRFKPRTMQLFDERSLEGGTLVTVKVTRDGLKWLRTEVWA
jgi:uncharacterized protein YhbP (UPF0306 family)